MAKEYAGRDIELFTLRECKKVAERKFSFISPDEIVEAFRLWSAGDIAENLDCFSFTVKFFGKVLKAYTNKRKSVLAELLRTEANERAEKIEEESKEAARKRYEKEFPKLLETAREKYETWQEIPPNWFRSAWKRKLIRLSKEEVEAYRKRAAILVEASIRAEEVNRNVVRRLLEGKTFGDKVKIVAGKLAIFNKFCK